MPKIKDKERIFKTTREKKLITYKKIYIKFGVFFLVILFKVGEDLFNIHHLQSFHVLIDNKCLQINREKIIKMDKTHSHFTKEKKNMANKHKNTYPQT